jgi:hypothetical protein
MRRFILVASVIPLGLSFAAHATPRPQPLPVIKGTRNGQSYTRSVKAYRTIRYKDLDLRSRKPIVTNVNVSTMLDHQTQGRPATERSLGIQKRFSDGSVVWKGTMSRDSNPDTFLGRLLKVVTQKRSRSSATGGKVLQDAPQHGVGITIPWVNKTFWIRSKRYYDALNKSGTEKPNGLADLTR